MTEIQLLKVIVAGVVFLVGCQLGELLAVVLGLKRG